MGTPSGGQGRNFFVGVHSFWNFPTKIVVIDDASKVKILLILTFKFLQKYALQKYQIWANFYFLDFSLNFT